MSKGGAGKVYFVLYLAVILELLIIIVERDEAEEHLIAKQKESMRIVESILSQLQVGAGSEGINTRPQDQITIPPPGVNVREAIGADIKPERKYLVEVGITDVVSGLKKQESEEPEEYLERMKRFLKLSNVSDLKYEILYSNDQSSESVPQDANTWGLKSTADLDLKVKDMEATLNQIWNESQGDNAAFGSKMQELLLSAQYTQPSTSAYKPSRVTEPEMYYSKDETAKLGPDLSRKKRAFVVNFEPREAGWYKLRFSTRTNQILGVSIKDGAESLEIDPEEKVNIGTVQLKVKDLLKVRDELLRNTENLPSEELLKTDPSGFDKTVQELKEKTDDLPTKSRIELYGAIVKLTTPGIKAENFDRNKAQMEFNIRVLKPAPQITDPKIADLETVVRVFDKLSKIELPMQVTPSNGKTEFLSNPGGASVTDAGAVASASSGSGSTKWVGKKLVIPVSGSLAPRDEPYVFELQQTNASKRSEPAQCSVYVYPSQITNQEELKSYLEMAWGDALELVAVPASGNSIKPSEFIMQFDMGAGSQIAPLRKLNVQLSDNVVVPPGASNVKLDIAWKDPRSGEVVQLWSGSGEVGMKKPIILASDMKASSITDNTSGEFLVTDFEVRPPTISADGGRANIGSVKVSVKSSDVIDLRTNITYRAVPIGNPRKVSGNKYEVTLKLQGDRYPLTKGQVKGSIQVTITATASAEGAESKPRQVTKTISVSN
jgi:hypothetical protein